MTKANWKWALLATVIVLSSCGKSGKQQTKAPIRVKVETVRSMDAREGQSYVGMVEEREATAVSFTSMGTVRRVFNVDNSLQRWMTRKQKTCSPAPKP